MSSRLGSWTPFPFKLYYNAYQLKCGAFYLAGAMKIIIIILNISLYKNISITQNDKIYYSRGA